MSLISQSSSAFSAVAEAQSVLRELRERVNRAAVEKNRNQQEAAALERRAENLSKEVLNASAECISFEQECARQSKFLEEIPDRLQNSMKNTDQLLEAWKQLDDQLAQLSLTERDIEKEQQARRKYFSDQVEVVERELIRYRDWHSTETARHQLMLNEAEFHTAQLTRQKSEVEQKICEMEDEIKQSKKDLEDAKQSELKWVHELSIAQEGLERQKTVSLVHSSIDELAAQIAEDLEAIEVQKKTVEDELVFITTACGILGEHEIKVEEELLQLKLQVQQKEQELMARRGSSTAKILAVEHEVAQLMKEIDSAETANTRVIQLVDNKAATLTAELNARISSETKALNEEEERLKADLDLLCSRMEQEKERWEKKILDRKLIEMKSASATTSKTVPVGKAFRDQANTKQIAKRRFLGGEPALSGLSGGKKPPRTKPSIPSASSGDSSSRTDSPPAFQTNASKVGASELLRQEARISSVSDNTIRTFSRRSSTINEAASSKRPLLSTLQLPSTAKVSKNDNNKSLHQPADNILKVRELKSLPNRLNERLDEREHPPQKRSMPQAPMFAPSRGLTIADVIEEDQHRKGGNGKGSKKSSHPRQTDPFRFRSVATNNNNGNRESDIVAQGSVVAHHDKCGKENAKVHNKKTASEHKTKKSKLATGEDQSSGSQFDLFN